MALRNLTEAEISGILGILGISSGKIKICVNEETLRTLLKCITIDEELETRQITREEKLRIARDSTSSSAHLEDLSMESDREILEAVASNPNTPVSVLQRFLYLNDDTLTKFAVRNLSLPRQSAITAGKDYPVDQVGFSTRTVRALIRGLSSHYGYGQGAYTMIMLSLLSEDEVSRMNNIGDGCLAEIKLKLAEYRMHLS